MQSQSPVEFISAAGDGDLELDLRPTLAYDHMTTEEKTCVYLLRSYDYYRFTNSVYGEWSYVAEIAFINLRSLQFEPI